MVRLIRSSLCPRGFIEGDDKIWPMVLIYATMIPRYILWF